MGVYVDIYINKYTQILSYLFGLDLHLFMPNIINFIYDRKRASRIVSEDPTWIEVIRWFPADCPKLNLKFIK